MIVVPITKRIEIIMSIQVCLISWVNIIYRENGGKKSFSCKSKDQFHVLQWGEHDFSAQNKKNGDYYEYPCLSHFMNELRLQGKWWKEKLSLKIQRVNIVYSIKENMIILPITKRLEIITSTQVWLINGWALIMETVEWNTFLANPKHQYRVSQYVEHDCSANNKRNRDYYEYPNLSHFMGEHYLQGKWLK